MHPLEFFRIKSHELRLMRINHENWMNEIMNAAIFSSFPEFVKIAFTAAFTKNEDRLESDHES